MIRFQCPECGKALKAPEAAAGQDGRCRCGHVFDIPGSLDSDSVDLPIRRRGRRKTAVVPSIMAVVFALMAIAAWVAIDPILSATGYQEKLDEWRRYGQYALHPRPTEPLVAPILRIVYSICSFLFLVMTAVAVLRAGRSTRA
jgi:hypothetical protein